MEDCTVTEENKMKLWLLRLLYILYVIVITPLFFLYSLIYLIRNAFKKEIREDISLLWDIYRNEIVSCFPKEKE